MWKAGGGLFEMEGAASKVAAGVRLAVLVGDGVSVAWSAPGWARWSVGPGRAAHPDAKADAG